MLQNEFKKAEVLKALRWLASLYPGFKLGEIASESYWEIMRGIDIEAIRRACAKAPGVFVRFFPTGPALLDLAKAEEKSLRMSLPLSQVAGFLPGAGSQTDHRLADDNPFEQMARKWERQSVDLDIKPWEPTPKEIGMERMRELNAMLDGLTKAKTMTT